MQLVNPCLFPNYLQKIFFYQALHSFHKVNFS